MAKFDRFDGVVKPFAGDSLATERTVFGSVTVSDDIDAQLTAAFLRGWGIVGVNDLPTLQDFNAMGYTLGYLISYLHQQGVAEWNVTQDYYTNNIVAVTGTLYKALDNNTGNSPTEVSSTHWARLIPSSILNNMTAVVAPTVNDDSGDGYAFGSLWYNTVTGILYTLVVTTVGAAVWKTIAGGLATTTLAGEVELATVAEAKAGLDTARAVTPEGVREAMGWVLVEALDIAAFQATVDFTVDMDTSSERYIVTGDNCRVSTDGVGAWLRLRQSGTYQTSNYSNRSVGNTSVAATPVGDANNADSKFNLNPAALLIGNSGDEQFNFETQISNPAGTSVPKHVRTMFSGVNASGQLTGGECSGSYFGSPSVACDRVRIMPSSGNILGKFKLWKMRKS